jgi:alpha-galactosidase
MSQFIQLHSQATSLLIQLTPAPTMTYWGKTLSPMTDSQFAALLQTQHRAVPQGRLDEDIPLTLCPEPGQGHFNTPGIEGHHDGRNAMPQFTYVSHKQTGNTVKILCRDSMAALALDIHLTLDQISGVLRTQMVITNLAATPYQLNKLAITLPVPQRAVELESYYGRWSREFQAHRQIIQHSAWNIENRRGRTSHEYFPGCLVGQRGFTEQRGEIWSFHLGWSGNHQWHCNVKSNGCRYVQASELLFPGEIRLQRGESYTTPELFAAHSLEGINGIRASYHHFVREHILPFDHTKPRPIHLNTWEGIYFNHDPDYLCQMATTAAAIGVERFIIDDGWFQERHDDTSSLGDWFVDRNKYPNGLTPVISHVNQLGMEFGIWVEPEMINPDSDLYRQHPGWVLATTGYSAPTGRNQYVLNLQIPACFDYLYRCLDNLLAQHNIRYVKWDMNRELVQPSHLGHAAVHGQTLAVYRLIDTLRQAHPEVEIESCASGGGRIDYEMLKRTCRFWPSDSNDALERQIIQKHMSIFFPPEVMGTHIGPYHSHTTRRTHDIHFRGLTALTGHMGVELDPLQVETTQSQAVSKYITLHKQYRQLLHSGTCFYLDQEDDTRLIYGVRSDACTLIFVCQIAMPDYALPVPLRLDALNPEIDYRITLIDYPPAGFKLMKPSQGWWNQPSLLMKGLWLSDIGLPLPLLDPESCLLLALTPA